MGELTTGVPPEAKHNLPHQLSGSRFPTTYAGTFVPGLGRLDGWGTVVPTDGDTGWAKAALFRHTDGSGGDDLIYQNNGDITDCRFIEITSVAGADFGATGIKTDVVLESTSATGVTLDGVRLKDGGVTLLAGGDVLGGGGTKASFVPLAAQQALSGAGAANITSYYTALTNTGADAITLVDAAQIGQLKKIQMIVDPGTDSTLTPSNLSGGTTIVFADVGDYCILIWQGTAWVAIELGNDADGATAPVLA